MNASYPSRFLGAPWFWISSALHAVVILGGGALFFHGAKYAVRTGVSSLEVNLVAAPQAQREAAVTPSETQTATDSAIPPLPQVSDMASQEATEAFKPTPKAVSQSQRPLKPSAVTNTRTTASDVGQDSVTARSSGGAYTEAKPNYLNNPPPVYPESARLARQEGLVILRVLVNALGSAESVQLETGSGYRLLDESALRAVRQWRFLPARLGSQSVSSTVTVPVRFRLDGAR